MNLEPYGGVEVILTGAILVLTASRSRSMLTATIPRFWLGVLWLMMGCTYL